MYKCSKCNLAVIVLPNEEPIKACNCNAPIIADIRSTIKVSIKDIGLN